jgi:acyl-coenzyme A synthetase/AMP-(fatty) acid ligase
MTQAPARIPLVTRAPEEVVAWQGRRPITVAELLADAAALAERLPAAGQFVNACADRYAFLVGFLACALRERACLLPGGQTPRQLAALCRDYPDSVVLTDERALDHALPSIGVSVLTGGRGLVGAVPALDPNLVACVAFTSGTTGQPVAHARNWGTLMLQMAAAARRFDLVGPHTVSIVATVPHTHMFGFETTILLPLRANVAVHGGTPLYPDDVRSALEALPAPRLLITSPVHLRALASSPRALPDVRSVISATAPLAAELAAQIEADCATEVLEIYGCTEAGSVATRRTVRDLEWTTLDGVTLVEAGEPGSGAACARLPHAPRPVPLHDVVTLLSERRFRLMGRREDMIKVGGKRGSLAGLTTILLGIEGVQDGVFVMPERARDDAAARPVVIVSAPGVEPRAILDELRRRIDPAFVPRRVIMTEALPRNPLGKLPTAHIAALLTGSGEPDPEAG